MVDITPPLFKTTLRHYIRSVFNAQSVYGALCIILFLPYIYIGVISFEGTSDIWIHIINTTLPKYLYNSVMLCLGVALLASCIGVTCAWLISHYRFHGRKTLEWLLLLPMAMPPYIIAFIYVDFFEYSGDAQIFLRALFNWNTKQDYYFFEVRSLEMAIIVFSLVLYPYIYIFARQAFRKTPYSLVETAIMCKQNIFWHVALPMARPFIIGGAILVVMESLADFGAVDFFALDTITLGIYNVWLGMNSLATAAQLSFIPILFIIALLWLEQYYRRKQKFYDTSRNQQNISTVSLHGTYAVFANIICLVPIFLGFIAPCILLLQLAAGYHIYNFVHGFLPLFFNSISVAAVSAFFIIIIAFIISTISIYQATGFYKKLAHSVSFGYGFPGIILAIGVIGFVGSIDYTLRAVVVLFGGDNSFSLLQGTIIVLFLGYVTRFLSIGYYNMHSSIKRLSPNIMEVNAVMGRSFTYGCYRILTPLLKSSFVAGFLLIFVDIMKELPMTLLLSPFDFQNLASYTYQYAKDEMLHEASIPAITIVISGLIPVIILNKILRKELQ